jgi:hypothetical protein
MPDAPEHGGCPQATRIDELCPACLAEWERWMEETAMPQLRQAIALSVYIGAQRNGGAR